MHSPWSQMFKFFNFGFLHPSIENLPNFYLSPLVFPDLYSRLILEKVFKHGHLLNKWINIREEYKEHWKTRGKFKKENG